MEETRDGEQLALAAAEVAAARNDWYVYVAPPAPGGPAPVLVGPYNEKRARELVTWYTRDGDGDGVKLLQVIEDYDRAAMDLS